MRKYVIATAVAIVVFAMSAFAATLNVQAGTLQAGTDAIGSCIVAPDDNVDVTYGAATFTGGAWTLDEITLDDDGACTGLFFDVVVTGASWQSSTETGIFGASPVTVTFDAAFDAEEATDVHLAIRSATP